MNRIPTRNAEGGTRNKRKNTLRRPLALFVSTLLAAASPSPAFACAACFGKSSDAMAEGMNLGIFALLIVIVSVLIGIASFFAFLARRSARVAAAAAAGPDSCARPANQPSSSIAETTS